MALRLAFFFVLLAAAGAARAETAPRSPTAKWVVNFAEAQCVAYRDYGTAESPLRLVLKAPPMGDVMQIAVLRASRRVLASQVYSTVAVDDHPPIRTNLLMYSPKGSKERVYRLNMPSADFDRVRAGTQLRFRSQGLNEVFALSQMGPLLKKMDECVADLRSRWNVERPNGSTPNVLSSRATANIASYVQDTDYPGVAIANGQSGLVRFVLLVGEDGRVADCTVIATSGVAALDATSCILIKERARFTAARGSDGKPAKDAVVSSIQWLMARH